MSVVEDAEKSQPSYTACRVPNGGVMLENSLAVPQKAKHRVANPMATILLPDIYPREMKTYVYTKMYKT